MSIYGKTVDFLPKDSILLYFIQPSGDYDEELLAKNSTFFYNGRAEKELLSKLDSKNFKLGENQNLSIKNGYYVPVVLEENLTIRFSVSIRNNLQKQLKPCQCTTPIIPENILKSINHACQDISAIFEKDRASKGGNVYDLVLFMDQNGTWKYLKDLRDQIFSKYREDFDRILIEQGYGIGPYLRLHPDSLQHFHQLIQDQDNLIKDLLNKQQSLESNINYYNNLFQTLKINVYQNNLDEFKKRLEEDYPETKGDNSWQDWIYNNRWLFGVQYGQLIQKEKVGFDNIPDFLLLTADGFLDVLEIKKPSLPVLIKDSSHSGNYIWSSDVSTAISQADNYLSEINSNHLAISQRIREKYKLEVYAIKPRAIILIGTSDQWNNKKKERFRSLNHLLSGTIEVITYTDLLRRGENLVRLYSE